MKKKICSFYITEDVIKKAKMEIPNLSGFVEGCLRAYLNITDGAENIRSIEDELNIIRDARLKIHLLTESDFNGAEVQEYDVKKQNQAWIKIWANYRNTEQIIDADILNAGDILGKGYDELISMMDVLLTYLPKNELAGCDDWNVALKRYEAL